MYRELSSTFYSPELDETDSFVVVILRSRGGGTIQGNLTLLTAQLKHIDSMHI